MLKQIRLRVNRIESYRDISGNLGKKIELVEDKSCPAAFMQSKQTRPESSARF
jgi:hypothetical protein